MATQPPPEFPTPDTKPAPTTSPPPEIVPPGPDIDQPAPGNDPGTEQPPEI